MPNGVHTGTQISAQKRQAIVLALAAGESKHAITNRLHTSDNIVNIVLEEQWKEVSERKSILLAQAERNAMMAGEQIAEAIVARKVPINLLIPVYGVSLDKSIALRNDPQQLNVEINPGPGFSDLYDRINNLHSKLSEPKHEARPIQANVIEA